MSTKTWRSSLANVETRLRRSLGLAGPIDLGLPAPLPLQPVVLADDATRPGGGTLRGRRFTAHLTASQPGAATVPAYLWVTDSPYGVIIDRILLSGEAGLALTIHLQIYNVIQAADLTAFLAAFGPLLRQSWYCDESTFEYAPLYSLAVPDVGVTGLPLASIVPLTSLLIAAQGVAAPVALETEIFLGPPLVAGAPASGANGNGIYIVPESMSDGLDITLFGRVF